MKKERPREQARALRKGGQTIIGDDKGKTPAPKLREAARPLEVGGLRIIKKEEPKASKIKGDDSGDTS